jgi:hypothetical protein
MKNKILNTIAVLGLILSIGTFNSCKNPTEGLQVTLNTDISTSNYGFRVVNANLASTEIPQNLKVKLVGPGANYIYSSDGTKNITAENGIFSLLLEPGKTVSPENPISFTVLIESEGYLKGVYPIQISATGNQSFTIPIVKLSEPPAGVSAKQETVTLNNSGETETAIVIETPVASGKLEMAKIEIPAGTKMLDENGNTVTGNVNISMVHFDNRTEESLSSFPGGFTVTNILNTDGQPMEPVVFETAGFISIEMNNGTQTVKNFSKPIQVSMEVNPQTINPETGLATVEGDSIPTWSLDTKTGQWKREGTVVVVKNTSTNKLETVITVPHLSWWNLDYFTNACQTGAEITVNSNVNRDVYRYMEIVNSRSGAILKTMVESVKNNAKIGFYNAPRGVNVLLKIYSGDYGNKGNLIAQSNSFSICGSRASVNVTVPPPTIVSINISGKCVGGRILRPSIWVYFKEKNSWYWNDLGYMNNGIMVTDRFTLGKTYVFGTYYSGRWYEYERTITSLNYNETMNLPTGTPGCR